MIVAALHACGDGASASADASGSDSVDIPDLSIAGPWIAFVSERGSTFGIYLAHPDGTDVTKLVNSPGADLFPSWSPDGTKLAYASNRSGAYELQVVDLVARTDRTIATGLPHAVSPAFSPDGSTIAFVGGGLFTVPSTGGTAIPLTSDGFRDNGPVWAPDGSVVYFASSRSSEFEVWSVKPDGTNLTQITTNAKLLGAPTLSPDGSVLAFETAGAKIMLWTIATGVSTILSDMDDSEPSFSSAGDRVAITTTRYDGSDYEIALVDLANATTVRLTDSRGIDGHAVFQPVH